MEKNIEKRDRILLKNKKEEYRIADIMGHSAVIRFDLQTLVLCTLNYVKQFLDQIPATYFALSLENSSCISLAISLGNSTSKIKSLISFDA